MADNFDLRKFLSENKLTKNAQLLNESTDKPEVSRLGWKALEQSTDPEISKLLADYKASSAADYDEIDRDRGMMQQYMHTSETDPRSHKTIKILQQLVDLAGEKGVDLHPEAPPVEPKEEPKVLGFWDKIKAKIGLKEENLDENIIEDAEEMIRKYGSKFIDTMEKLATGANKASAVGGYMKEVSDPGFDTLMDIVDQDYDGDPDIAAAVEDAFNNGDIDISGFGHDMNAASNAVAKIVKTMNTAKGGLAGNTQQNVKESALSSREKYLTRLVENALGLEGYGDDNVNKQREKQGLPPAQGPKYSEGVSGDEMVNEKPLPEYKSIEELMKNIDHGTNEAACKYKMTEMKRIAQALEEKVSTLEEGEHAEHIDTKKVKQMKKDIMTLRKQADKLEKEYEKKFGEKKVKKEDK